MKLMCYEHGVEEDDDGAYKVCGECWHVWPTELAFRQDVEHLYVNLGAWFPGVEEPPDLAQVYACPLCAHDF